MAALKVNKGLYIITVAVVVMLFGLFTVSKKASEGTRAAVVESSGEFMTRAPTPKTADADTTTDTINAIGGHLENVEKKVATSNERAAFLEQERKKAIAENKVIAARYETKLNEFTEDVETKNAANMETILRKMDELILSNHQSESLVSNVDANKSILVPADEAPLLMPAGSDLNYGYDRGAFIPGDEMLDVFWIEPLDDSLANRTGTTLAVEESDSFVEKSIPTATSLRSGMPNKLLEPLERNSRNVSEFVKSKRLFKPGVNNPTSSQNSIKRIVRLNQGEVDDT